jgi:hypothetical protein
VNVPSEASPPSTTRAKTQSEISQPAHFSINKASRAIMQAGLVNTPVEKSAPATASCDGDIEAALVEPAGAMISHSAYHAAAFSRRQQVELIRFGAVGSSNDPSSGAGVRARAYPADYDESDSDNESDDSSSTSTSDGAGADSGGGTQGTAPQRTFETFEVEEQSTEIKVLKSILEKKASG